MLKLIVLFFGILFCTEAYAVQFTTNLSDKQPEAKAQVNEVIEKANHCNNDSDCGSISFDCREQDYNRREIAVVDLVDKYKNNEKFKPTKCSSQSVPSKSALCRNGQCVR